MPSPHRALWKPFDTNFTAVFPPGFDPDPDVVAAIRKERMPNFVPLWCVKDYITPTGSIFQAAHYVLASWEQLVDGDGVHAGQEPLVIRNLPNRSPAFPFRGGVYYEEMSWTVKWPQGSWQFRNGMPEIAKPFDWSVYWYVSREVWRNRTNADADPKAIRNRKRQWYRESKQRDRVTVAKVDALAEEKLNDEIRHVAVPKTGYTGLVYASPGEPTASTGTGS